MDKTNKLQIPLTSKQFFSVEEAALFIGVSRRTFFKMKKEGRIEYIQIGRRIIFDKDAVINLVKNLGINPSLKWRVPKDVEIEVAPLENIKPKNKGGRKPSAPKPSCKERAPEGVTHETHITMSEACSLYGIKYGTLYSIRTRYKVNAIRAWGTTAFERTDIQRAVDQYREDQGQNLSEHWYTTFQIQELYGLGPTQIRRYAEEYKVRTKKIQNGHAQVYLKADWDEARKASEERCWNTKAKRSDKKIKQKKTSENT